MCDLPFVHLERNVYKFLRKIHTFSDLSVRMNIHTPASVRHSHTWVSSALSENVWHGTNIKMSLTKFCWHYFSTTFEAVLEAFSSVRQKWHFRPAAEAAQRPENAAFLAAVRPDGACIRPLQVRGEQRRPSLAPLPFNGLGAAPVAVRPRQPA